MIRSVIIGSGSYIPKKTVYNTDFHEKVFYDENGSPLEASTEEIIKKFHDITEIEERKYVEDDSIMNSDIAAEVGNIAVKDAGIDKEELDYIIVAHNFGDVRAEDRQVRITPSVSALVKSKMGVKNLDCRPYDMIFGCPGWVEGMIMADNLIKAGAAKKILVIGSEILSRTVDPYDRNSLIFADGAAGVVLEGREVSEEVGIIKTKTRCDNGEETCYITTEKSLNKDYQLSHANISMKGRKVYEYALSNVPVLIKDTIDEAGYSVTDIKKVLIHQANAKMDHAMLQRVFKLYGLGKESIPEGIAPMIIQKFGNSSVATVPIMYDLIMKNNFEGQKIVSGDIIVFASVGAGMNINAIVYKVP